MIDLNLIKKQVKEVIEYSQDATNVQVNYLIDIWYKSKKDFINFFNGELIYSTGEKITIDLTEEERNVKIDDFCNYIANEFPQYKDLFIFIRENEKDFFKNILSKTYNKNGYNIPAGIKIFKAFKEFVNNKEDLDNIQTEASRVVQESKITGYLYFSVHPLDYLSSSENNYNWRSCHSLDGEYRAGNLSYMLDESTVVCYLCNKKQVKLPRFPESVLWNDKKWRMLLFVSDNRNALFAGRHYPFFSKSIMEEIRLQWAEISDIKTFYKFWSKVGYRDLWSNWHDDFFKNIHFKEWDFEDHLNLNEKFIPMKNSIYRLSDLVEDNSNLHYNDILHSSCYNAYYCWFKFSDMSIHFTIGHPVKCLKCENEFLENHELMFCDYCFDDSNYIRCNDCGTIINRDDAIYIDSEDRYICSSCYEDYYFQCANCGEIYHNDDAQYDSDTDEYYCLDCYHELHDL